MLVRFTVYFFQWSQKLTGCLEKNLFGGPDAQSIHVYILVNLDNTNNHPSAKNLFRFFVIEIKHRPDSLKYKRAISVVEHGTSSSTCSFGASDIAISITLCMPPT